MDFPTRLDLYQIARTYIKTRARKIDPGQIDIIGSDINLFVGANMVVCNEIVNQLAAAVAKLFIDSAEREDLDRLAWDRYQEIRKAAAPALVNLVFSRLTSTAGAGAVPVGTRIQNNVGIDYITTTQATFGATTLVSTLVAARSVQAGKLNSAAKETVVRIPEIGLLWDKTITVTNPEASAFASDKEEDEDFRGRLHEYWNTARRGTLRAIAQGALATPGVASASAVEELTAGAQPARVVQLYLADADGVAGPDINIDLSEYRAAGIQVIENRSMPQLVDIKIHPTFQAGKQTDLLTEAIRTSIVGTVNKCTVNGTLYLGSLRRPSSRLLTMG